MSNSMTFHHDNLQFSFLIVCEEIWRSFWWDIFHSSIVIRFYSCRFLGARLLILALNCRHGFSMGFKSGHIDGYASAITYSFQNPSGRKLGHMLQVNVVLKDQPFSNTQALNRCLEVFIRNSYIIVRFHYLFYWH